MATVATIVAVMPDAADIPEAARQYTRKRKRLLQVRALTWFLLPLIFSVTGASSYIGGLGVEITRSLYLTVAGVWVAYYTAVALCGIPISYFQYGLDKKFGVARGSAKQRAVDAVKADALALSFGLAVIESIYFSMNLPGEHTWLFAAVLISLIYAALVYLLPAMMPLFYRLTPVCDERLRARLLSLAQRAGVQIEDVYEWHISGRTRRANAMVAGWGGSRKVILTDTLIEGLTEEEIEALIAHEFGHYIRHDVGKRVALRALLFLPVLWALQITIFYRLIPGSEAGWTNPAMVPVMWTVWLVLSIYGNLVLVALARKQEKSADRYAWELIDSVKPFVSAMKKLTEQNLIAYKKSSQWQHSHPATSERIAAAEKFARKRELAAEADAVATVSSGWLQSQ